MKLFRVIVAFWLAIQVLGLQVYTKSELAPMACGMLIGMLIQPYNRYEHQHLEFCDVNNQPALGSMAICLFDGGFSDYDMYLQGFLDSCASHELTSGQVYDSYANASELAVDPSYYRKQVQPDEHTGVPGFELPFIYPINMTNQTHIQGYFKLLYKDYQTHNWDIGFGVSMVAYWFAVMGIAGVCNLLYFTNSMYIESLTGGFINWYRRNITLAPLFHKLHALEIKWPLGGILPTRLETLLLLGWFVLLFAFCFPQINQPIQGTIENAIGDRFANLAVFNFPLLILFAGRNNFMQWITGWSYSRFLTFHRWIARVVFLVVMLHGILETLYMKRVNAYLTFGRTTDVVWGYVGITAMAILVFQSLYVLRSRRYEIFLLVHILMAIVTIISGWHHTKNFNGIELFYASVAVWALDRVIRLFRLISFGIQPATLQLKANETVKVTVNRPSYWKPYPGSHAFIHFLKPTFFWQSHPFTMIDSVERENTISFYFKVKGGMSHGLYQQLSKQPDQTMQLRVMVEGPYSQRIPVCNFRNIVFLAGGNGVPGMYYEAMASAQTRKKHQTIKFYWIIRHFKSIEWFLPELIKLSQLGIEIVVFVTKPGELKSMEISVDLNRSDDNSNDPFTDSFVFQEKKQPPARSLLKDSAKTLSASISSSVNSMFANYRSQLPNVEFRFGRPDMDELVEQDIYDCSHSLAFVTCAHPAMVDDVRHAVRMNLQRDRRIELFEQIQQW